jgi:hypothetical protein
MEEHAKYRSLVRLFLKLETRNRKGSRAKLLLMLISYLIPGIFLPYFIYKQNIDPTGFEFAFLTFLFFSMIFAFTMVSEFDNLVISKTELDILSVMPVDIVTVVKAKLTVIFRYVLIITIPLLLPSFLIYSRITGSFYYAWLYYLSGLMFFFFIVYILLFIYSALLKNLGQKRLGLYVLMFQMILILILIIGYQFVTYYFSVNIQNRAAGYFGLINKAGIIQWLPPAWFAFIPARLSIPPDYRLLLKILLPLVICYMSYLSYRFYFNDNFMLIKEKLELSLVSSSVSGNGEKRFTVFEAISSFIEDVYLRNSSERSSYKLMTSLLKRDKNVRLIIIPLAVIPLALTIFALLVKQLSTPIPSNIAINKPVLHIAIMFSLFVVLNTAVLGIKVSNYTDASWIYDVYPMESRKRFINGIRKFFVIYILLPVCAVLFLMFIFTIPVHHALVHVIYIFVVANLYNSLSNSFTKDFPLTKENTMFNSLFRVTSIVFPFLFGVVFTLVMIAVYSSLLTAFIASGVIFLFTGLFNYFSFSRLRKQVYNLP